MFSCCSCKGKAVAPVEKSTWGMVIKPTLSLNSRVLGDKFQLRGVFPSKDSVQLVKYGMQCKTPAAHIIVSRVSNRYAEV